MKKNISLLFITSLSLNAQAAPFKKLERIPETAKAVTYTNKYLGSINKNTIKQKQNDILEAQKELQEVYTKNSPLKKMLNEKKLLKNQIRTLIARKNKSIIENKAIFQQYVQEKNKKNVSKELQNKIDIIKKLAKNQQEQLANLHTRLHLLKEKLKKASSQRLQILQKLHNAKQELKQMLLADRINSKTTAIK